MKKNRIILIMSIILALMCAGAVSWAFWGSETTGAVSTMGRTGYVTVANGITVTTDDGTLNESGSYDMQPLYPVDHLGGGLTCWEFKLLGEKYVGDSMAFTIQGEIKKGSEKVQEAALFYSTRQITDALDPKGHAIGDGEEIPLSGDEIEKSVYVYMTANSVTAMSADVSVSLRFGILGLTDVRLDGSVDLEEYGSENKSVDIISDKLIYGDIKIYEEIDGLISKQLNNDCVPVYDFDSRKLTFDDVSALVNEVGYGDKKLAAKFEQKIGDEVVHIITVHFDACLVTRIINDEAQLNSFVKDNYGKGGNPKLSDGYFILGNDIKCTGVYPSTYHESLGEADVREAGFAGTFNGRGKVIDGLHIANGKLCGFVWQLTQTGVIKNVSFINAIHEGSGGFLVGQGMGTVENVYVQVETSPNGLDWGGACAIIAFDTRNEFRAKNIMIDYINPITNTTDGFPFFLYWINNAYNVYAIGTDTPYGLLGDGSTGEHDTFGVYPTRDEMMTANIAITAENGWDMSFWTIDEDSLPIPRSLQKSV